MGSGAVVRLTGDQVIWEHRVRQCNLSSNAFAERRRFHSQRDRCVIANMLALKLTRWAMFFYDKPCQEAGPCKADCALGQAIVKELARFVNTHKLHDQGMFAVEGRLSDGSLAWREFHLVAAVGRNRQALVWLALLVCTPRPDLLRPRQPGCGASPSILRQLCRMGHTRACKCAMGAKEPEVEQSEQFCPLHVKGTSGVAAVLPYQGMPYFRRMGYVFQAGGVSNSSASTRGAAA